MDAHGMIGAHGTEKGQFCTDSFYHRTNKTHWLKSDLPGLETDDVACSFPHKSNIVGHRVETRQSSINVGWPGEGVHDKHLWIFPMLWYKCMTFLGALSICKQ